MGKSEVAWKKRHQEPTKKKLNNWYWLPPKSSLTSKTGKPAKLSLFPSV